MLYKGANTRELVTYNNQGGAAVMAVHVDLTPVEDYVLTELFGSTDPSEVRKGLALRARNNGTDQHDDSDHTYSAYCAGCLSTVGDKWERGNSFAVTYRGVEFYYGSSIIKDRIAHLTTFHAAREWAAGHSIKCRAVPSSQAPSTGQFAFPR
jgi:hypothetical protein